MKIYIAGMYSRRLELLEVSRMFAAAGHKITARWLDGDEEKPGMTQRDKGQMDVDDVVAADVVILFSTPKEMFTRTGEGTSGGRHFEFGLALGLRKKMILVGPPESVFHHVAQVLQASDAVEALRMVTQLEACWGIA